MMVVALGCAVEGTPAVEKASVQIEVTKVEPPMVQPVHVPRQGELRSFEVTNAVVHAGIDAPRLRYRWYWDYVSQRKAPLELFQICGLATPRCVLLPCTRDNSNLHAHRLLLVVSDADLAATAQGPFDYPAGAHVDAVHWDVQLVGNCPGK